MRPTAAIPARRSSDLSRSEIDRDSRRILQMLADRRRRIVVVHGGSGHGKSELLRDHVLRALSETAPAYYVAVEGDLPAEVSGTALDRLLADGATIILDDFDRLLMLGGKARIEGARELIRRVNSGELRGKLVLALREECLSDLLAFRSVAPDLLDDAVEILRVSLDDRLRRMATAEGRETIRYSADVLQQIKHDLAHFGRSDEADGNADEVASAAGGDLVEALDAGFRHYALESGRSEIERADYEAIGRFAGVLRRSVDARIEAMPEDLGPDSKRVARAAIVEVIESRGSGQGQDFAELSMRLGVDAELVEEVIRWHAVSGHLFEVNPKGAVSLRPRHLNEAYDNFSNVEDEELDHTRALLAEAVRAKALIGAFLPEERIQQVHRLRESLRTSEEETILVLLSVLNHDEPEGDPESRYWLGRLADRDKRLSVLIEGLFGENAAGRAKAARLLSGFDDARVTGQLYRKALEDTDATVRENAMASLVHLNAGEKCRQAIEDEVGNADSVLREAAVRAMRLIPSESTNARLKELATDSRNSAGVRAAAIDTLAAMGRADTVEDLIEIGLDEGAADVRDQAAAALAMLDSEELVGDALRYAAKPLKGNEPLGATLRASGRLAFKLILAALLAGLNIFVNGVALLPLRRYLLALAFVSAQALTIVWAFQWDSSGYSIVAWFANWQICHITATRLALRQEDQGWRGLKFTKALGVMLAALSLPVLAVHGSVNFLLGHWRRGMYLLFLEVLGIGAYAVADYCFDGFRFLHGWRESVSFLLYWFYSIVCAALFAYTLVADLRDGWRLRKRHHHTLSKHASLLAPLLRTQQGTRSMLDLGENGTAEQKSWALDIVEQPAAVLDPDELLFQLQCSGEAVKPFLKECLALAKPDRVVTQLISDWDHSLSRAPGRVAAAILLRHPTEESLKQVRERKNRMTWGDRMRSWLVYSMYPVRFWPRTAIWAGVLLTPFVLYAPAETFANRRNPAPNLLREIRLNLDRYGDGRIPDPAGGSGRDFANLSANFLASNYADKAADGLVDEYKLRSADSHAVASLRESITILRCQNLEEGLANEIRAMVSPPEFVKHYRNSDEPKCGERPMREEQLHQAALVLDLPDVTHSDGQMALDLLERDGSARAIEILAAFVTRQRRARVPKIEEALLEPGRWRRESELRIDAKASLARDEFRNLTRYQWMNGATATENLASEAINRHEYDTAVAILDSVPQGAGEEKTRALLRGKVLYLRSVEAMDKGQKEQMEGQAIAVLSRNAGGESMEARRLLALIYVSRSERELEKEKDKSPAEALRYAEQAIAAQGDSPGAYGALGAAEVALGDLGRAAASFTRAAELDSRNPWPVAMKARILLQQSSALLAPDPASEENIKKARPALEEMRKLAEEAIARDPSYPAGYYLLSKSYTGQRRGAEGIQRFTQLMESTKPPVYWIGKELANLYLDHSPDRTAGAKKSLELLRSLDKTLSRSLAAPDLKNHKVNLLESEFTASNYATVLAAAAQIGPELGEDDFDLGIPAMAFAYAAAVITSDMPRARAELTALGSRTSRLPDSYRAIWDYGGATQHLNEWQDKQQSRAVSEPLIGLFHALNSLNGKPAKNLKTPLALALERSKAALPKK